MFADLNPGTQGPLTNELMSQHSAAIAKCVTLLCSSLVTIGRSAEALHNVPIETDQLRVIIADNEAFGTHHRAGYNGVAELTRAGDKHNFFVPEVAGLNLEHIFSGDAESFGWNIFEPRRAPMRLARRSPTRLELGQESTEHWPLRSQLTYEVDGDAINFTYCGTPLADAWTKHGYIGVFFASYINKPEDMSIEFIGRARPGRGDTNAHWIKHLPPKHGVAANHRPAGSAWDPPLDNGFTIPLVQGISDFEYVHPFYFGRSGEKRVRDDVRAAERRQRTPLRSVAVRRRHR
jgi:hypothetical protein